MASVINRKECKRILLELSTKYRNGKFTRVGADVLDHFESTLHNSMIGFVRAHPSVGKTLMTGQKKQDNTEE